MSKTCTRCGGAGGRNPCPEYNPFDWYTCSYCNGAGVIKTDKEKREEYEEKKSKLKNVIRNDRNNVW